MNSLCKRLFVVSVFLSLLSFLSLGFSAGCAKIPGDGLPDDPPPDTLVFADTAFFDDMVAVCLTAIIGGEMEISCDTTVLSAIEIPYMVTRIDDALNNYCLYPVTFTAFPRTGDLRHIEAVSLDLGRFGLIPLYPPDYSATFSYADTGTHAARMLVGMKGSDFVLAEEFLVRIEEKIDVSPVSVSVSDTGSFHTFRAGGMRYRGVYWVWDLTNIGGDVIKTLEDTVSVFIRGGHNTAVSVYQEDTAGRRTPGRSVRFTSVISADYTVVVNVEGGEAEVLPQRVFTVPYGGGVSITVDVSGQRNMRLDRVTVNGSEVYVYVDTAALRLVVGVANVRSDTEVLVAVAEIDTVMPMVTLEWPPESGSGPCFVDALAYRLNKKMASGVIKWRFIHFSSPQIPADSTITVNIPQDINSTRHIVGNIVYTARPEYLDEGLRKYSQRVSPNTGKWSATQNFSPGTTYILSMEFTDSLERKSNFVYRTILVQDMMQGCTHARRVWEEME
ncbi:MAG: hypothetical protein FWC23_03805 [Chitinispirillia bacterium]|nr:hypothetical protein [Chitinispirillia bacterium]MCL2268296.1 hypothetical protein [Chitinispirillia bacterium]